jgi:hypothetical protein
VRTFRHVSRIHVSPRLANGVPVDATACTATAEEVEEEEDDDVVVSNVNLGIETISAVAELCNWTC